MAGPIVSSSTSTKSLSKTITDLPDDIFSKVFSSNCLNAKDIARYQATSKSMRIPAEHTERISRANKFRKIMQAQLALLPAKKARLVHWQLFKSRLQPKSQFLPHFIRRDVAIKKGENKKGEKFSLFNSISKLMKKLVVRDNQQPWEIRITQKIMQVISMMIIALSPPLLLLIVSQNKMATSWATKIMQHDKIIQAKIAELLVNAQTKITGKEITENQQIQARISEAIRELTTLAPTHSVWFTITKKKVEKKIQKEVDEGMLSRQLWQDPAQALRDDVLGVFRHLQNRSESQILALAERTIS